MLTPPEASVSARGCSRLAGSRSCGSRKPRGGGDEMSPCLLPTEEQARSEAHLHAVEEEDPL